MCVSSLVSVLTSIKSTSSFTCVEPTDDCQSLSIAIVLPYSRFIFEAEIFVREAKFKFRKIKISKITNFEEISIELVAT